MYKEVTTKEAEQELKEKSYSEFKKILAEILIKSLDPFREKRNELESREVYVREILNQGAKRAQVIAQSTMSDVKKKMGL